MAWQRNGTPDTLTVAGGSLVIADLTPLRFNVFLCHTLQNTGTTLRPDAQFDNLGTSIYATRFSQNGGTDGVLVNQTLMAINPSSQSGDFFFIAYGINIISEEKLLMSLIMSGNTAGAGNAPTRAETVHKSTQSVQYKEFDVDQPSPTNEWAIDSNLSALGTN